MSFFTEPLQQEFMVRALASAVIIGVSCAVFSCFLILKGWSLMGDAVSHAVLPGLALSYVCGLPLGLGAFGAGLLCAFGTGYIKSNSRVKEDAILGIVFSGMFALGLVMLTKIETDIHLMHVLFGNVLGASVPELIESSAIGISCALVLILKRRDFELYCFDPTHAQVSGLKVKWLHFGLLVLLSLTIVSALKTAGIILVVAMLIAPGASAFLVCGTLDRMLIVAVLISVTSCILGTLLSYHFDADTAPFIVIIQAILFVILALSSNLKTALR
ncbi:metal ABC transporter permease [Bdellovibrio sp. HCB209]|uniref:metal ABC transporter permease n=1 Tax=Bdellovibrio sp. HCB209 TaxID=3394354 RepID=UPI0039B46336